MSVNANLANDDRKAIPPEIIIAIFSHLSHKELALKISLLSKSFSALSQRDQIWKPLTIRDWPQYPLEALEKAATPVLTSQIKSYKDLYKAINRSFGMKVEVGPDKEYCSIIVRSSRFFPNGSTIVNAPSSFRGYLNWEDFAKVAHLVLTVSLTQEKTYAAEERIRASSTFTGDSLLSLIKKHVNNMDFVEIAVIPIVASNFVGSFEDMRAEVPICILVPLQMFIHKMKANLTSVAKENPKKQTKGTT